MSRPDVAEVREAARGHWLEILPAIEPKLAPACGQVGRHVACPVHGGKDGFRLFPDAAETGGGTCNTCGSRKDGFAILMWLRGWTSPEAVQAVADYLGVPGNGEPRGPEASPGGRNSSTWSRPRLEGLWSEATPGHARLIGYLEHRGLQLIPYALGDTVRLYGGLPYYDEAGRRVGLYPALLLRVENAVGELVALHRIYLDPNSPGKAPLDPAKKLTPPVREGATRGAAIRLFPAGATLALAEGVETALAVTEATRTPAWSTVSAGGMEAVMLPPEVRRVDLWGDNDENGRGQRATEVRAAKAHAEGLEVHVLIPPQPGQDWLDVLSAEGPAALRDALATAKPWAPPTSTRTASTPDRPSIDAGDEDGQGGEPTAALATGAPVAHRDPWQAAQPAPEFLRAEEAEIDFLEDRLLARGSITEWFSPRGLGKTLVAHAYAVKHARLGRRVLLLDRDNSRREVKRRLRAWGAGETPGLKVLTRDRAPAMTDKAAWAAFPFSEYDVVVIDSIDAATEGVGEQDSARPAAALAPILDIAHREAGPAILLLGNVIKSGAYGRGSGVVEGPGGHRVRGARRNRPPADQRQTVVARAASRWP